MALFALLGAMLLTAPTASRGQQPLSHLFESVNPTVVVVRVVTRKPTGNLKGVEEQKSLGSGVVVDKGGQVLTAAHLVRTADEIVVEFLSGHKTAARVSGSAPDADLSLLTLEELPPDQPVATLADSDKVAVGDDVVVIGAPYGLTHTLTRGIVSGRHVPQEYLGRQSQVEVFQTDASINQGNSGGPMFNMQGEVIGIVSSILSRSGGFEGIGFAVTANTAKALLLTRSSFWTGVDGILLEPELAGLLNVPQASGMLVQHVAHGSPADQIGLQAGTITITLQGRDLIIGGDIILQIEGFALDGDLKALEASRHHIQELQPGDQLSMLVLRKGKLLNLSGNVE